MQISLTDTHTTARNISSQTVVCCYICSYLLLHIIERAYMMSVRVLFLLTGVFLMLGRASAWGVQPTQTLFLRRISASLVGASLLSSSPVLAEVSPVDAQQQRAVEQIMRVQKSLKYIDDSIEKEGNPSAVVQQINLLLKNYKLKENLATSLNLIPQARREEARTHGTTALEDLQIVSEYFDDDIDNMSGKKTPPRQVLQLAMQASSAAAKELRELIAMYPSDVAGAAASTVGPEFDQQ